ncbi:ABC transporter ATP-binding protein [Paenibacillus thiaminolyticus]|uniref:ABC transporter ATP-binding protein n=1 Tax=Paenibacillus thiaminolyticus TaxID=49283 RepID=UPI003D265DCB
MNAIQLHQLTKRYGEHTAVQDATVSIRKHCCTALLGPNGAGKTTTLHMLAGLIRPTSGEVRLLQEDGTAAAGDLRQWVGFLSQTPAFYGWMSGSEWLVYHAELCGMPRKLARSAASQWLEKVGLADAGRRRISGYSGGMKQRLGIAQAMIGAPKLVILDEPVSALDPIGRREVMTLLQEIAGETTVLFSTHILSDAEELCDDLIMMNRGRIVMQGQWEQLRSGAERPRLTVEVEPHPAALDWLRRWAGKPEVEHSRIARGRAEFTVRSIGEARRAMLTEAADMDIPLLRLECGVTSLEDMFMEAMIS